MSPKTQPEKTCANGYHQFWRDNNPPNCFGCGRTKLELQDQEIQNRITQAVQAERIKISAKAISLKINPSKTSWERGRNSGLNDLILFLTKSVEGKK